MSKFRGTEIAEAIKAHVAATQEHAPLREAFHALTYRGLGERHFDEIREFMQDTARVAPIKLLERLEDQPNAPLASRHLSFFLAYILSTAEAPDIYIPALNKVVVSQDTVLAFARRMPLEVNSGHIEFRHLQRSASLMTYDDTPFLFACAYSLMLAEILEPHVGPAQGDSVPVLVPHPQGAFLGHAVRVPANSYLHDESVVRSRKRVMLSDSTLLVAEWLPALKIVLKTYLSTSDLFPNQRRLRARLNEIINTDFQVMSALQRNVDCYTIGSTSLLNAEERATLGHGKKELRSIVDSELWRQGV